MSKYSELINKARSKDTDTTEPENQNSGKPESLAEPSVNLSIKVPASHRRHWVAEAKRNGLTITAAVTQALNERFGEPE
jgi:hypothetical protein